MSATKIGFASTGLCTYWGQFKGLLDHLEGYSAEIIRHIEGHGAAASIAANHESGDASGNIAVINAGMVDSPEKAQTAAELFREAGLDLLVIYVATYSLSSTVLPMAKAAGCPCLLLNLQPGPSIDFKGLNEMDDRGDKTGLWLEYCQACSIPEIAGVFNRSGIRYDILTGHLKDDSVWEQLDEWVNAATVLRGMNGNRLGVLGHYYCGMLDVYTDLLKQASAFGTHIELIEMDELASIRREVSDEEIKSKRQEFAERFEVSAECSEYELDRAARTSVALDKLVKKHNLGSMAYYYEGSAGNEHEDIVTSVIAGCTLLTGAGVPVAGECEIKNAQAMKIMSLLGAGGSFSEFYAMDFDNDVVLLGHDGPAHYLMSDGKVRLVPLPVYHGKPGQGLSIQMSVKDGDVTLMSVCEGNDGVFLLVAEGQSVSGEVLEIGNTNSRYRFDCGMQPFFEQWCKAGPSHHCAIGIGHVAGKIRKFATLAGIKVVTVG